MVSASITTDYEDDRNANHCELHSGQRVGWSDWLGASTISLPQIMHHLHSTSCGALPSSIRIVEVFDASWTFTPRTCRVVDPMTTARWKVPAGMKAVSPCESLNTRVGVS